MTILAFAYPRCKENIIENISLEGKQGEIIGITGSIASGKSTLGISLLGLYPYIGKYQDRWTRSLRTTLNMREVR